MRGNRNTFEQDIKRKFPKIESIMDYDIKIQNKGNKLKYFEVENIYKSIFDCEDFLSNEIRNSVGHH